MANEINGVLVLVPGRVTLAQLRSVREERVQLQLHPAALRDVQAAQQAVARTVARGAVVYGINTGFGKFAQKVIPVDRLCRTADESGLVAQRRHRRVALRRNGSPGDGPQGDQPGAGLLRGSSRPHRGAASAGQCARVSLYTGQGLGGRFGRPGAAGAHGGRADRCRRSAGRRTAYARARRAGPRRARTARACTQGRPGFAQRHTGVHRLGLGRPVRSRRRFGHGARHRRLVARSDQGIAQAVRRSHPRRPRPQRTDRRCPCRSRVGARQRYSRLACELRSRPGSLFHPLPAASHGRLPGQSAPRRPGAGDRKQRGLRQSSDLCAAR